MFRHEQSHVDENFDFIVLDFAAGLVSSGHLDVEIFQNIEQLYRQADEEMKGMTWQEEDAFLAGNSPVVSEWKSEAARLLGIVEAHNKSLKADAVNGAA